jgi:dihydrofolate synthase/folylpolyglutamate synthase
MSDQSGPTTPVTNDSDYQQALDFLYARLNFERADQIPYGTNEFKLDRMRHLLRRLDDPHLAVPTIHVAGTKGKGSTAFQLSAVLTAAGYRTGCYTSPHLVSVEERFAVDGQPCSRDELIGLIQYVRPIVEQLEADWGSQGDSGPTFFEVTTAMAFLHFAWRRVQCAVLEVGLGGRLDSTNVCQPRVCIITTISFDHMRQLGHTLAAIAGEKAGIIKPRVPVVTGVVDEEPWTVIRDIARQQQSPIRRLNHDFTCDYHPPRWDGKPAWATMDYYHLDGKERKLVAHNVRLGAWGQHQAANAALAWAACEELRQIGMTISDEAIRYGLEHVVCPGRIEILPGKPIFLIDTAHNAASIQALVRVIRESFPQRPRGLILAATQGKDVAGMLHALVCEFDLIICTRYLLNPRGMPEDELVRDARRIATAEGSLVEIDRVDSPAAAWALANARIAASGLVCITGSFFLAAEFKQLLAGVV